MEQPVPDHLVNCFTFVAHSFLKPTHPFNPHHMSNKTKRRESKELHNDTEQQLTQTSGAISSHEPTHI